MAAIQYDPFGQFQPNAYSKLRAAMAAAGTNPQTLEYLKAKEGYAPRAKWDYKQWSGGYGTRAAPGQTYTPESAQADLQREADKVSGWIDQNVTAPMTLEQKTSLTDFGYNLGTGPGGLSDLLQDVNAGDWRRVSERMQGYNHAGGAVNSNLTSRRADNGRLITGDGDMGMNIGKAADDEKFAKLFAALKTNGATSDEWNAPDISSVSAPPPPRAAAPQVKQQRVGNASLYSDSPERKKLAEAMMRNGYDMGASARGPMEAIGSLAQVASGAYDRRQAADEDKTYQQKLAEAMGGATDSASMARVLMGTNDPALRAAGVQMFSAATGPKAQDWVALPAQTNAYGDPMPPRVMNKHTGEIKTVGGEAAAVPAAGQQTAPAQQGVQYGPPKPKPPEGYIHASDENGFIYENGQPKFILKADADTSARKREINMAEIRTNAQGATDFLRGLNRARGHIESAPDWTFGTIASSDINQAINRSLGTNPEKQKKRDEITAALRDLELSVAQMKLKGQGQVTEAERKIAKETLPTLDRDKSVQMTIMNDLEKEAIAKLRRAMDSGVDIPAEARDYLASYEEAQKVKEGGAAGAPDRTAPAPSFIPRSPEVSIGEGRSGGGGSPISGFPENKPVPPDAIETLKAEIAKGTPDIEQQFIEWFGLRGKQIVEQIKQGQQPQQQAPQTAAPLPPSPQSTPPSTPKPKLRYNPQTGELEPAQ